MRVLIIEDETAAARNLEAILREVEPEAAVLATLESVEESIAWLRENTRPDLIFMDIHLADGNSLTIFREVEVLSPVVFTTAYDQYALDAFKVNSIDYLLKPLNATDVRRSLEKLRRLSSHELGDYRRRVTQMAATHREDVFLIHIRDKIIPMHRDRIAYIYTANDRVIICDNAGQLYPIDKTLESLQALLPDDEFFRANRQFIVARRAIEEVVVWFGSRLALNLTVECPEKIVVPKARVGEFKLWLKAIHAL